MEKTGTTSHIIRALIKNIFIDFSLKRGRWTDYKIEMRTNVPIFKVKEASVRRRYSDFKVLLTLKKYFFPSIEYFPVVER